MTHIFIINPYCGRSSRANELREKLSTIEGLNYYVFNTRYKGHEKELISKIKHFFEGEKLRFYCCGGSGTMHNMLSGFDDLSKAEVAFYPCGMTNDFLKTFEGGEEPFGDIRALINGDVIKVDYFDTNIGPSLNTISFGLDSQTVVLTDEYRDLTIFGEGMPYSAAIVHAMLLCKAQSYDVEIDGEKLSCASSESIFGNGNYLGGNLYFSDSNNNSDGKGGYMSAPGLNLKGELKMMMSLMKKDMYHIRQVCKCGEFSTLKIRRTDGLPFILNFDGEAMKDVTSLDARLVRKGLSFVVPKGIRGYVNE